MEDLEKWMKIIEDGPDAEEVLADQEEEGSEELEEAGCGCGSYDCESCFPSNDVTESTIEENEIYDQVIDLAEDEIDEPEDYEYDNEYTDGTDTESDDVELDETPVVVVSEPEEEWTSADADYFDDELPEWEQEWDPDMEELRALAGIDGIGEQYDNADGEDSPFTDSSMNKDLEEAEPDVEDEDEVEVDDTIVDLGDDPDLEPEVVSEPTGEVKYSDADTDIGDLIAKIQYMQDMGISMSDRYYDADKLWAMKPEFIQRIHAKVVGESIDGYDVEELDAEEIDDSDYDMGGEEISDDDYRPVPEGSESEMQTQAADDESEAYANFSNSQDNIDESLKEGADVDVVKALNALFG
jgi:hypothetical protein